MKYKFPVYGGDITWKEKEYENQCRIKNRTGRKKGWLKA